MFSTSSTSLSLQSVATLSLTALPSHPNHHFFLSGSCSPTSPNSLSLILFNEETNSLSSPQDFTLPNTADQIMKTHGTARTTDADDAIVTTIARTTAGEYTGYVAALPNLESLASDDDLDSDNSLLPAIPATILFATPPSNLPIHTFLPGHDPATLLLATTTELTLLSSTNQVTYTTTLSPSFAHTCASPSPHTPHTIATLVGPSLTLIDPRTPTPTTTIPNAHKYKATCMDWNPNRPQALCSGGQDGVMKFWDLRKANKAVNGTEVNPLSLSGHSHWLTNVAYNPSHDQLMLSTSTDSTVCLWGVSSVSSAPLLVLGGEGGEESGVRANRNQDSLIERHCGHKEPVYGLAWSASDAWCFASGDVKGEVVVDHVSSEEKYRILL